MTEALSVVIAAHNGERFIEQQLRSVLDQSLAPAEVLVGDDASTDATVAVVERIAGAHPNGDAVSIVRRDRALGIVGNFEDLLERARGRYIALADQDDVWMPERLERVLPRLKSGALLSHHDATLIDETGAELGTLFGALRIGHREIAEERAGRAYEELMRRNLVTGATVVLDRELLGMAGRVPPGWIHDEWLAVVAAAVDRVDVQEEKLVGYRQHGANEIGARRLDAATVVARFRENGTSRNDRLLQRARSLADRVAAIPGVPPHRIEAARQKLDHELVRSSLVTLRPGRIPAVARELATGRYADFGHGWIDAARDLLQPIRS